MSAWRNSSGQLWPRMLCDSKQIDDVGIYMFEYRADIYAGTYSLNDAVASMREFFVLDKLWSQSEKNLIFVGHSQGGVVARRFILANQRELFARDAKVGLFLVASPSGGSYYANFARQLAPIYNVQVEDLRSGQLNTWLNGVHMDFMNLKEKEKDKLFGKELIEDNFVVAKRFFRRAQIVSPDSAARYFGDAVKIPNSDHWSIAKPESAEAMQHRILVNFIDEAVRGESGKTSEVELNSASESKTTNPILFLPPRQSEERERPPPATVVPVPTNIGFKEVKPGFISPALFFEPSEFLAEGLRFANHNEAFYIRVIPTRPRSQPLSVRDLYKLVRYRPVAIPSDSEPASSPKENSYGAIAFETCQILIIFSAIWAFTQLFKNGEIWGVTPDPFIHSNQGSIVQVARLEKTFQRVLEEYCLLETELDIAPPYHVEIGAAGLRHARLALQPVNFFRKLVGSVSTTADPIERNEFKVRVVMDNISKQAQLEVVDHFILSLLSLAGATRP